MMVQYVERPMTGCDEPLVTSLTDALGSLTVIGGTSPLKDENVMRTVSPGAISVLPLLLPPTAQVEHSTTM